MLKEKKMLQETLNINAQRIGINANYSVTLHTVIEVMQNSIVEDDYAAYTLLIDEEMDNYEMS